MNSKPQILIVDDDLHILRTIEKLLSKYRLNLTLTASSIEALDIIQNAQIDLILCDQRMPELEGISLLLKVKELSPNTIRILMSGYSDINVLVDAINSGSIYQYIQKPWDNDKFIKIIFKALEVQIEEMEQNTIFQKLLKSKTWINALSQTKLARRSDFLNNLLKHPLPVTNEIMDEAKTLGIECVAPYQLCLISQKLSDIKKESTGLHLFHEMIFVMNMLPRCVAWSNNGYICVIIFTEHTGEEISLSKAVKNITVLVKDYSSDQFIIGISDLHNGLSGLKVSYEQAYHAYIAARNSTKSLPTIIKYSELGVLQLLVKLHGQVETDEYVDKTIGKLVHYDNDKGSDLIHTLEELLMNMNMKEAAAKLFIHPKTMVFRKNRIEKILNISFEDYETRLNLGIALKLYKLK